jgi:hypothetical protein
LKNGHEQEVVKSMKNFEKKILVWAMCFFATPLLMAAPDRDAAMDAEFDALVDMEMSSKIQANAQSEASLLDGKAYVYKVEGRALLLKEGSPVETLAKAGDLIQRGDQIVTEKNATVAIAFDMLKKNAVQIPAETRAVFSSIEPTDIKLEDGTVFSAVDGLPAGSTWKVTTPSAVAAVRGTVYLVTYEASNGDFFAATVDVPDDEKNSAIEIRPVEGDGEALVPEGKEITLREGEIPSNEMVQDLKPEAVTEVRQFFEKLRTEREESSKNDGGNNNPNGGGNDGGTPPNGFGGNQSGQQGSASGSGSNMMEMDKAPRMPTNLMEGVFPQKSDTFSSRMDFDRPAMTGTTGMDKGFDGPSMPTQDFKREFDRMDKFDGPPGGEFGAFAGGSSGPGPAGTNLPPLDQTQLPGSTIFNQPPPNMFCDSSGCHPKPPCTSGTNC